jgi:hypothetical protein
MLREMPDWFPLLAVVVTLIPLVWLNRWIHRHLHGAMLLLTGRTNAAMMLYFLLLLPGVLLHELSHWLMAKLLLVRTFGFTVWPKRQRDGSTRLGSVEIRPTDSVRASLIGAAPLISGSIVVLLIGNHVFGAETLGVLQTGDVGALASALWAALKARDMWIWLYLLFAVANAMIPSPTDREPWLPVILFLVLVVGVAYGLGFTQFLLGLAPVVLTGLRALAGAFAVTLMADVPFVVLILCAEWLLGKLRNRRIEYR